MSEGRQEWLPAVRERTVPESEYRALVARSEEAARLAVRVAELEQALVEAEGRNARAGEEDLMLALLPALDDLERALGAARARQDYAAIVAGVDLVRQELVRVLGTFALEPIPVRPGDALDVTLHQTLEGDELFLGEGFVVDVCQRAGFKRGKKVLRRAIVSARRG